MKITKLTYQNLKGRSREFTFDACNLIVGKNFEGKSSIFDAIRLAMLGYVPGNPPLNTNQAIFQLASGPTISALVETDSPAAWKAEYTRVKQSIKESGLPFLTDVPTQMLLDPYLYFGAKVNGNDRVKLACELLSDAVDFGPSRIMDQLRACPTERTAHASKIIDDVLETTEGMLMDGDPPAAMLALLDDKLKEQESSANKVAKTMQSTMIGLSDLAGIQGAMEQLPSVESLDAAESDRALKAAELNQAIGTAQAALAEFARNRQERARYAQRFAAIAELPVKQAELAALREAGEKAIEEEAALRVQLAKLQEQISLAIAEAERFEVKAAELRASAQGEEKWIPLHSTAGEEYAKASGWEAIWKKIAKLIKDRLNITTAIFCLAKKEPDHEAEDLAETYEAQACNARSNADEAGEEIATINTRLLEFERASRRRLVDSTRLEGAILALEHDKAELAQTTAPDGSNEPRVDEAPALREQLAALNQEAAQDRQVRQRIASLRADKQRTEQAAAEKANVAVEVEILKFMRQRVKSLREALVDESMDKALSVANRFCTGVLQGALAYYDGEVGKSTSRGFVPYATFSGAERTLATMALSVALASRSEVKVVLLDEIGNFSEENLTQMFANLAALVADETISQFIAISPRKSDAALVNVDGLRVIDVG